MLGAEAEQALFGVPAEARYAGHKGHYQELGMSDLFGLQVPHCGKGGLQFH